VTASYGVRSVKHLLATTLTGTLVAAAGTATALFLKRTLVSHSILLDGNLPRELLGGLVRIFHFLISFLFSLELFTFQSRKVFRSTISRLADSPPPCQDYGFNYGFRKSIIRVSYFPNYILTFLNILSMLTRGTLKKAKLQKKKPSGFLEAPKYHSVF